MNSLRLYSPSIVFVICGLLLSWGVDGKGLLVGGALALLVALFFHTLEEVNRHVHR